MASIGNTPEVKEPKNMKWTSHMDAAFIEQLLKFGANLRNENGLTKEKWNAIATALSIQLSCTMKVGNLKNHLKHYKKQYFEVKELRDQSGFEWDNTLKLVNAPANTWEAYLKSHPEMAKWRRQTLPIYDQLEVLMGDNRATGSETIAWNESTIHIDDVDEGIASMDPSFQCGDETQAGQSEPQVRSSSSQSTRSHSPAPMPHGEPRKKKKSMGDDISTGFSQMVMALKHMSETDERKEASAVDECLRLKEELKNIPGLERGARFKAMHRLTNDDRNRTVFLALEDEDKFDFIIEYIGQ